jgi:RpiB/LacA/LacB family sugar-phosphate isomerase
LCLKYKPVLKERMDMRIVLGSDHAGYDLKRELTRLLHESGYEILDVGTSNPDPVDYPDFAEALAKVIRENRADRGILICGSGVGASIAANKIPGIRAGVCHDAYSAHQSVEHDDVNVLVMGARIIGPALAQDIVSTFLKAKFTGEERHVRRLGKIKDIEKRYRI